MEAELLDRCRAGDPQAIESLVRENQTKIYRLCLSVVKDPDDAEDAVQESFMAALKALDQYRGDSAFSTWLYTIALNTSRGLLRQRARRHKLKDALTDNPLKSEVNHATPEGDYVDSEQARLLWEAIDNLDEKHRLPVVLRYFHDLSTQEIADMLDVNVGTVHSRLHNARNRLGGALVRIQEGVSRDDEEARR